MIRYIMFIAMLTSTNFAQEFGRPLNRSGWEHAIMRYDNHFIVAYKNNLYAVDKTAIESDLIKAEASYIWNIGGSIFTTTGQNRIYLDIDNKDNIILTEKKTGKEFWNFDITKGTNAKIFFLSDNQKKYIKVTDNYEAFHSKDGKHFKLFKAILDSEDGSEFHFEGTSK